MPCSFFPNNLYTRRSAFHRQILTRTFKQRPVEKITPVARTRTRWRSFFSFFYSLSALYVKRFRFNYAPALLDHFRSSSIPRLPRKHTLSSFIFLLSRVTCQDRAGTFRLEFPTLPEGRKDVNCEQRGFRAYKGVKSVREGFDAGQRGQSPGIPERQRAREELQNLSRKT